VNAVLTTPPKPPNGTRHEFRNVTPVSVRMTRNSIASMVASAISDEAAPCRRPRRSPPVRATHAPTSAMTTAASSFTDSARTTKHQYHPHRPRSAAQIAPAIATGRNESGWKFSSTVHETAGCTRYAAATTAAAVRSPSRTCAAAR